MSRGVIFQNFRATNGNIVQFIPFVRAFYAFVSPLFYNHHNHESDVTIIPSIMGTCQSDALKRALFTLAHFKALCFIINHFLSYLFRSIADNTHIISPPSIISYVYEHFKNQIPCIRSFYSTLEICNLVTFWHNV